MSKPQITKSLASKVSQHEKASAGTTISLLAKRQMATSLVDGEDLGDLADLSAAGLDETDAQAETPEAESNATGGALPQTDDGDNDNDNDDARERALPDHFRRDPADDKM